MTIALYPVQARNDVVPDLPVHINDDVSGMNNGVRSVRIDSGTRRAPFLFWATFLSVFP
jgi:hypothetical protein